jgi:uncharacterized repeat protein (TIGR03803 family)
LIADTSGNLYGTTELGGTNPASTGLGSGTVFELSPPSASGGKWTETILQNFGSGTDGAGPFAGLIADPSGNLYGTTSAGGLYGPGTVFEISGVGTPPLLQTVLTASPADLNFGNIDASASSKPKKLTLHNNGTTAAVIGQLSPPASFTISHDNCSNKTVNAKQDCTVEVAFTPATVAGSVTEPFVIPYNGNSPPETLAGNGIAVTLDVSGPKTLPGAKAGAIGKAAKITITNKSTATVLLGPAGPLSDFTIATDGDGCADATLKPGSKCVVTVQFAPGDGTSGELASTLSYGFTYGANDGDVSVPLKGKVEP